MDTRQSLDGQAFGIMFFLCLIWGLQQVVLKAAASDISPLMQIAVRSGISAVLVGALMLRRGERISLADGHLRPGLWVGFLFALEFLLVGEGLRYTSASHMVVFLYTAPIFVALGLHWQVLLLPPCLSSASRLSRIARTTLSTTRRAMPSSPLAPTRMPKWLPTISFVFC